MVVGIKKVECVLDIAREVLEEGNDPDKLALLSKYADRATAVMKHAQGVVRQQQHSIYEMRTVLKEVEHYLIENKGTADLLANVQKVLYEVEDKPKRAAKGQWKRRKK